MNTGALDESVKDYYRLLTASKAEKNVKQKLRFDAVLLHMDGYPGKQISQILHIPLRTVNYHISRYKNEGIEALTLIRQPGAPRKLSDVQEAELLHVISTKTPQEAGVGIFANWTAALACSFVEQQYGVSFSTRGMLNLFQRLGLSYTRPTYTLNKADAEKQEQFRKTFESLKKTAGK